MKIFELNLLIARLAINKKKLIINKKKKQKKNKAIITVITKTGKLRTKTTWEGGAIHRET